jgi:hypothetical protein
MACRDYFLKQAETCLKLARSTTDLGVARKLTDMAAEFQAKAETERDAPNHSGKESAIGD